MFIKFWTLAYLFFIRGDATSYLHVEFADGMLQSSRQIVARQLELVVRHFACKHAEVRLVGHRLYHVFAIQLDDLQKLDLFEQSLWTIISIEWFRVE